MRKIAICSFLLLTLPFAARTIAQDQPKAPDVSEAPESAKAPESPAHYYYLDFVVRELDENGKPVNSRAYSCMASTARGECSVRVGSKVPIATGSYNADGNQLTNTQFQYQDVGVNFDVGQPHEMGSKLAMYLKVVISGLESSRHFGGTNGIDEPVLRENRWQAPILIPIGKPTMVFTSDNVDGKGAMQVEVTAALIE